MPNCELPALLRRDVLALGGMAGLTAMLSEMTRVQPRAEIRTPNDGRMFGKAKSVLLLFLLKNSSHPPCSARISRSAWVSEWRFSLNARPTDH